MTTASTIAFPTMEVSATEDTMEMASPLPGHADDFEIDLDVMEDQTSNADKDMMGADDYSDDSIDIDYNQDGGNDADMADDVAEPTMVDADDQYPETSDNVEMQYSAEETYEEDMLEEDGYDPDVDVPMPKSEEKGPATVPEGNPQRPEDEMEPVEAKDVAEKEKESHVEPKEEHAAEPKEEPHTELEQPDRPELERTDQGSGLEQNQLERVDDRLAKTNQAEPSESQGISEDNLDGLKEPGEEQGARAETQPLVDHLEHQEPEATQGDAHQQKEQEQEAYTEKPTPLHTVKVYYQENEISLFPPREGDSSETFFVDDESLAYESFGKLFESFRGVLQEHIGDNEILVVDIDSLNIQLTEDSLHISKVTLNQIINLYLNLCDNDRIDEPEALYLTLSTRLTIPAAISDLLAAANEGKGLSEIYPWDEYEEDPLPAEAHSDGQHDREPHREGPSEPQELQEHEEPAVSEVPVPAEPETSCPENFEVPEEQEKPEPFGKPQVDGASRHPEAPQQDTAVQEDGQRDLQQGISSEAAPDAREQAHDDQGEIKQNEDDERLASNGHAGDIAPADGDKGEYDGENVNGIQEHDGSELSNQVHQLPNDEYFDSEEQKTESTATIASLPVADSENEQQYADQTADAHQTEHDEHDEYHGFEAAGEEDYPNEGANQDAPDEAEYPEESEYNGAEDAYYEAEHEQNAETSHEKPSEFYEPQNGDGNEQATVFDEDVTNEASQGDLENTEDILHDQLEPNVEDDVPELTQGENQGTPGPADDLLGIAEDVMASPAKNAKDINGEVEDLGHVDSGEAFDRSEDISTADAKEGDVEDVAFDGEDDEYLNLNFDDEFGHEESAVSNAVPRDNVSTKRTREPENETKLSETTPDVKRSRSS